MIFLKLLGFIQSVLSSFAYSLEKLAEEEYNTDTVSEINPCSSSKTTKLLPQLVEKEAPELQFHSQHLHY